MTFDFDRVIDRRGTHCAKWDAMEQMFGVSPDDGIPMWVADMDFAAPPSVAEALRAQAEHGVFGYYGDPSSCKEAICDFYAARHAWRPDPAHIAFTHGLVAGTAICVQAFTDPGDSVILFTPVYHAFHKIIRANGREILESQMPMVDGRYELDLEALEAQLTGREKMLVFCSPHNPSGRVWSPEEIRAVAAFCEKHDLVFVSDEIHCDLVFPGAKHTIAANAAPDFAHRTVVMIASTKTFNIAGAHMGSVVISDPKLKARFDAAHMAAGASPNAIGMVMTEAAWRGGADWLDALVGYLDGNRKLFDEGVNAIPGLKSMELESTYLAWVDFSGTGMEAAEYTHRVEQVAKIAANHGPTFGKGGEGFLRFNFATRRALVEEAVGRLQDAFKDLQ
ncbi:MalY/PatB family protein [Rhodovulum sp. DZ06]|uniref:MalY/PatB family protein n=1 Tax=Rhodovulum sp. DZ06 TaxID=3425126 RepID=UPI003D32F7AE